MTPHALMRPLSLLLLALPLACTDHPTSPAAAPIAEPSAASVSIVGAQASPTLYAHSSGRIVEITPGTATVSFTGSTGYLPLEALAAGPDGALYATHADPRRARSLLRIDPATADVTEVGPLQPFITGLAFSPAGVLHGMTISGEIYTLDTATAGATHLATLGFNGGVMDLAFDADGVLYAAVFDAGRQGPTGTIPGTGDQLLRIDLANPAGFTIAFAGEARGILGIEFDSDGVLWGTNCQAIQRIDPATGKIGAQTNLPGAGPADCFSDLAPAPQGTQTLQIEIDVRPGSTDNPINRGSRGVVPVAILGAPGFDVGDVDPATVRFAGAAARLRQRDLEDVNGDGHPDRMFHFDTRALDLADGATEACLTGSTIDGTPIEGCDAIKLVR